MIEDKVAGLMGTGRLCSVPGVERQSGDALEVSLIVRDECAFGREGMRGDHGVDDADGSSPASELVGELAEGVGSSSIERQDLDRLGEDAEETVKFLGLALLCTKAEFGKRERADRELGRAVRENGRGDFALAAQRKAHGVRVEEEKPVTWRRGP